MSGVAIVDNGGANIASLRCALERLGADARLTADRGRAAGRTARDPAGRRCRRRRHATPQSLGLVETIRELRQPLLGICLGMQLLFDAARKATRLSRPAAGPRAALRRARRLSCAAHGLEPARVFLARSAARRHRAGRSCLFRSRLRGAGRTMDRRHRGLWRILLRSRSPGGTSSARSSIRSGPARRALDCSRISWRSRDATDPGNRPARRPGRATPAGPFRCRDRIRRRPIDRPRHLRRTRRAAGARRGPGRRTRGFARQLSGDRRTRRIRTCCASGRRRRSRPRPVKRLLDAGVARVVVGSAAVSEHAEVASWLREFGPDSIVLAFDVRLDDGGVPRLATHGWEHQTSLSLWDAVGRFEPHGLAARAVH